MLGLPLAFASPWILAALGLLPVIWWLLRLTPPRPQAEVFPPFAILARIENREETPAQSPWWLTLLRLAIAALAIMAMAGPVWNPEEARLQGEGPVLIVIDNGWASGRDWPERRAAAIGLVEEAREASRPVLLVETANIRPDAKQALEPQTAVSRLESMENLPLFPDHAAAAETVRSIHRESRPGSVFFLSDGLGRPDSSSLIAALGENGIEPVLQRPADQDAVAISQIRNDPDALSGKVIRVAGAPDDVVEITAFDLKGLPLSRQRVQFDDGQDSREFRLTEPVELRNQIVRIVAEEARNAGAVQLLDDSYRRRLVGLISGEAADSRQPLLSPLYYIDRALAPYSDIRRADAANLAQAVPALIEQGVSAIVMADIGNIPQETADQLRVWIANGGMLIRFAGPRLAGAQEDQLLPVELRRGDRSLGGALSWDTPKPVAPFENGSPFFGLDPPREVLVERQVLALQSLDLESRTWAVLDDGTPLVTADRREKGWIVLFHVSSDATWSNLPISGTFVEMLRRVVNQSRASGVSGELAQAARLPPLSVLNGRGGLVPPSADIQPLVLREGEEVKASAENPPGFYGTEDGFFALNLFTSEERLTPLQINEAAAIREVLGYGQSRALELLPYLLLIAALLLALDCVAVLVMAGAIRWPARRAAAALAAAAFLLGVFVTPPDALAQDGSESPDFSAALTTRLAYVRTGIEAVDSISEAGLSGLTQFIASRTALEPGAPIGLDLSSDELSFYPLIYWPISVDAALPSDATMARVDAFMRQGGSILFDTRDQFGSTLGGTSASAEARMLQAILSSLDIPPLEPVPPDHVLTKAFYLLDSFPGRYSGGELWVEAIAAEDPSRDRPARSGDGVSSILITSNDMAAAWALDQNLRPMFQTIPPDPFQRELSFRAGVNLVMYAMTGNYKADQVHIPALLERLGQ